ncbi:MAG: thiamine-phosphate kinase [Candidatus Eisenbacteria bacterium]
MTHHARTLGDLGEFGVIEQIRRWLAESGTEDPTVRIGIGDDVAVVRPRAGRDLLMTCDVQVAGKHFVPSWMSGREIGRRAYEVNASDIAAKGGTVLWVLVSLGLPPEFLIDDLEEIYRGILEGLSSGGAGTVVGGNLTSTVGSSWFLDLTVVGECDPGSAFLRSTARVGDAIFVTGVPGSSAAGLMALSSLGSASVDMRVGSARDEVKSMMRAHPGIVPWIDAYIAPRARTSLARDLASARLVRAALDVSDGMLSDVFHLCTSSDVAAAIDLGALPHAELDTKVDETAKKALGIDPSVTPWPWILGPSDDYELLFTAEPGSRAAILTAGESNGVPIHEIGEIVAGPPRLLLNGSHVGRPDTVWTPNDVGGGWDHFGGSSCAEGDVTNH